MSTMRNLATFVTLGRLDDHAPGTCVAWMDSADRVCGKPVDDYLCPRHVKVAERKRDKEVTKEKARREKVAAAAEAKRPAREARLAKIEARLRQIDPFLHDDRPFDHGEQNVPLHKRMPSEARIAELARLHREANSLRQTLGDAS